MRNLKIIQLVPELNSGGVERGTLELGKYLCALGHESIIISNGGILVEQLLSEGSRHIKIPIHRKNPCSLLQVLKLRRLFLREKPDIVHARSRVPAWVCFLALSAIPKHLRPRFITTVHGFYSVNPYSDIMTKGDAVICVSQSIREYVLRNYPKVQEEKLVVIHRGIEHEEYPHGYTPSSEWLRKWNDDFPEAKNKKLILLPGRISRLKGHETFIKLIAKLPADFQGIIAGDTHPKKHSYEKELHHLLVKSGLKDRITFVGKRDDLKEVYAVSLATLSLSEKPESFGRTVLEALAIGCPVIGYNEGGVGEILSKCFPFGLINRGEVEVLKQKILELDVVRIYRREIFQFLLTHHQILKINF